MAGVGPEGQGGGEGPGEGGSGEKVQIIVYNSIQK